MIYEIYRTTGDEELVKRSLPALLKEYEFWNSGINYATTFCLDHYCLRLGNICTCTFYLLVRFIFLLHLVDIHKVTILDAQGCTHTLNRYNAMWDKPRPESFIKVRLVC